MHETLFEPLQMGSIAAKNRVMMAPLTRGRSTQPGSTPNAMMETYYRQRAGAGLIISEATGISVEGSGWPAAPGIWSEEQVEGWKPITRAVHDEGGAIVLQLWHMGRLVHPDFLGGAAPVSASATTAPGHAHTFAGRKDYEPARALETAEIARVIADYVRAAVEVRIGVLKALMYAMPRAVPGRARTSVVRMSRMPLERIFVLAMIHAIGRPISMHRTTASVQYRNVLMI